MTKKTIFDVEGIDEFNNHELLRPLSDQFSERNTFESVNPTINSSTSPKQSPSHQLARKRNENIKSPTPSRSPKKGHGRNSFIPLIWFFFLIGTAALGFYIYTIYIKHNSNISKLILHTSDITIVTISFFIWLITFITLLFITNKKIGILFTIVALMFANFSAFKANEIAASFQKLFDTNTEAQSVIEKTNKNILTDPFTVLILGVDSDAREDAKSSSQPDSGYLSDTMILVTINPKTHKADMVTTPRDTFLNDSCSGNVRKLNSFISGGVKCTINALQSLYNITIDYYIQANFSAVVQIVDALGGVEVNVPNLVGTREQLPSYLYWITHGGLGFSEDGVSQKKLNELAKNADQTPQWCDVDSYRNPYAVCFSKFGTQVVDGEHALAFARTRHYDSDYARGMRQTELIRSIIQKIATPSGLFQIQSILEQLKKSYGIETNMTFSQMTDIMSYSESLLGQDNSHFQVRKYQPLGAENKIYPGSGIILYKQSIIDIRTALSTTLEIIPPAPLSESEYYDTIEYPSFKTN